MTIATGKLTDTGLAILRDKVDALNRRAVRLGLDEMTLTVVQVDRVTRQNPTGLDYTVCINHVEVEGCPPCIDGWEVVARIEFTEAGNLVHCAPHIENLDCRYRTIGNVCEHCNTNRRRNDIIVIRHSDGRELCVGRNCLADYIRSDDTAGLIEYAGWLGNIERMVYDLENEYREYRGEPLESVMTILQAASICIRKLGWVSGREGYENGISATKNDVHNLLYPPNDGKARKDWDSWVEKNDLHVSEHDINLAAKALSWAQSVEPGNSDYLANLKVVAQLEWAGSDKFGYIVSMIPAYNREVERETERAALAENKGCKVWFGEIKRRDRNINATCVGLNSFEGHYGVTTLVRFEHRISDNEYAVLVWFASGDKTEDFEVGNDYTFDATCKKHDDHDKYGKQTIINRVTVTK